MFKAKISEFNKQRMINMKDTGMNAQDFKNYTDESPDKRKIRQLEREIKYLKASTPQETLEETITEVLCDEWIDYIDSDGNKRDPDGLCPAELENAFINVSQNFAKFFEKYKREKGRPARYSHAIPSGASQSFSSHSSEPKDLYLDKHNPMIRMDISDPGTFEGLRQVSVKPLEWVLMIAITKYIEGHVIDADDIVYVAEKR